MSSEIWKKEVIEHRGEYSLRLKLALHTSGRESLSWPSTSVSDIRDGRYLRKRTIEWMKKDKTRKNYALVIRDQLTELALLVAYITGGNKHMRKISLKIMNEKLV